MFLSVVTQEKNNLRRGENIGSLLMNNAQNTEMSILFVCCSKNYQNDNVCFVCAVPSFFYGSLLVVKVVMFHKKLFAESKNWWHSIFWCDACRKPSDKFPK